MRRMVVIPMKMGIQYFQPGWICLWHESFLDSRLRGNDRNRRRSATANNRELDNLSCNNYERE
jgi:hypothetical protein